MQGKFVSSVNKSQARQFDIVGSSPTGGFSSSTFGSSQYEAYWTVKGDIPSKELYECGTAHRQSGFVSPSEDPAMVATHHSVWFRGSPPSEDEARNRFLANASK